jgi:hypothetical protein
VLVVLLALFLGVKWLASHGGTAAAMPRRLMLVSVLTAVMGAVALTRFDVLPAALTVGTLVALASSRWRLGGVALGAAIAVKLYPIVLLPLVVVYVARRAGRRTAVAVSGIALGVVVIAYAPFLYLSVEGVRHSVEAQLLRPLQVESLGGSLLAAFHTVFGFQFPHQEIYYDFPFHSARSVARASAGIGLIVLVGLWIGFARSRADTPRLIRFSAATLAAFIGFGKVFSPQYLLWIIPLVALVPRKRGLYAIGELGLASLITALVFPRHFTELAHLARQPLAAIIVRDLLILALVATLAWPTRDASHFASIASASVTSCHRVGAGENYTGPSPASGQTARAFITRPGFSRPAGYMTGRDCPDWGALRATSWKLEPRTGRTHPTQTHRSGARRGLRGRFWR